jgi:lysophospholipase L1-like esterase
MARTGQVKRLGAAVAGVLTISLIAGAVFGEGTSPAAPAAPMPPVVTPAPFSPECQGGSTEIVTESPLPHVAAALQKRRTVRILAIGNSTGRRQGGFTRQIERILKQVVKGADVVIINRGVSGELAANASLRIKNEVAMTSPDLVIWQVGTDDALAFVPLDEVRETVESTIRWLKEHNVDVVLAGLQYVDRVAQDDNYYRMREMLRDVAAKEHVMIIRRYEAMQFIAAAQAGGSYGSDEFERTEAGYNCLAQYLASAITVGAFGKGMSGRPLRGQGPPQQQQQAQPPQQQLKPPMQ